MPSVQQSKVEVEIGPANRISFGEGIQSMKKELLESESLSLGNNDDKVRKNRYFTLNDNESELS